MPNKLDFPKGNGNNVYIAIYVPSTQGINKRVPTKKFRKRIKQVVDFLRKELGGTTRIAGIGNYYSDELKKPVEEKIAKVESFTTVSNYYKADKRIRSFLKKKKKEWKQESIGYIYRNSLYFV